MQKLGVEDTIFRRKTSISVRGKVLDFRIPKVMGIVNVTPDSFYSGSTVNSQNALSERVKDMLLSGADILDVGGYSSRPGADDISVQEEIDRVCPAIEQTLRDHPEAIISVDTFRSEVADRALQLGAGIINDISGFRQDPDLPAIAANYNAPYILMHMRGTPKTMQSLTEYENLFTEMAGYFSSKMETLRLAGVKDVILDPGFGFAKTMEDNHRLLQNLDYFQFLEAPILVGISRKSMIYKKLGITPESSLNGTTALNTIGLLKGASILRVHDVKEAKEVVELLQKDDE
ncbi:dihydropteroate synthase [bacterium]|nr:dihydropteroate synthase [bacterium]MDB2656607.1 dihydropteroate synthase [Crocinitomicaceae bacterium]